jgi:hypothetical protein
MVLTIRAAVQRPLRVAEGLFGLFLGLCRHAKPCSVAQDGLGSVVREPRRAPPDWLSSVTGHQTDQLGRSDNVR